jgi:hypothetical protein
MDPLAHLSEPLIHRCLEDLDGLWVSGAQPGDDDDNDALEVCPACGEETCQVLTLLQVIRDDACTGRFNLHCPPCDFSGVIYAPGLTPASSIRGAVSLEPYTLP